MIGGGFLKRWMILLAAALVLLLLAGCGKEPAVAGLSNEEFHQYFAEDYARPVSNITEITEENGGWSLKTDSGASITAMKDGTVVYANNNGWNYGYGRLVLVQQEDCYLLYAHCSQVAVKTGDTVKQGDKLGEAGSTGHTDNSVMVGVYRFPLEDVALVTGADGTVSGFTVNGKEPLIGIE